MNALFSELKSRLSNIREDMSQNSIDSLLVSNEANIIYLTGGETGAAVIEEDNSILWLKKLYIQHNEGLYLNSDYPFEVREFREDVVTDYLGKRKIKLGVGDISMNSYQKLVDKLNNKPVISDIVELRRMIKSDYELELLRKSADIAKRGMDYAFELVTEGITEAEAAAEIESVIRREGSMSPPFEKGILLASGSSGADIHAKPSLKKIENNSLVIVDLGARYNYYFSDMTRTIPGGRIGEEEKKAFDFVKNLEEEAIERLEVGMKVGEVHNFVEGKINKEGYDFYHSTGHGVGLEIHELPSISSKSDTLLSDGMVFTIEPGVYVPKKFGVRFEDTIAIKNKKFKVITR